VAKLQPQHEFRTSLNQKPEPSSSEVGESRVRNRGGETWPTKHLTHAL
jgi:hypothetical protein